ncbi:Phosphoadenosine phosphosulfate reductase family protein [Alkalithermobacter thermoalcaliphilus JW-YL-7 = DSM 7308]|uniref:Phosphoadenosine phosphosulfate reductase n=1 Tax=Alkalithermobacter thermoalcaliphilus JW-YL-7 = DSM 7308 TaxID=1121328 RepID=A0A150FS79_CLOPD|nr:phosphoadenosine phosphosulfate reductase [[Clostridium] paradoxum JW-YL-7 = DSM 7308]SHL13202.1 Phosphoadenosine phosphosulfate reductase family protein [[Clostridium] paradoxum JW-YL-7 = DSM 7308]
MSLLEKLKPSYIAYSETKTHKQRVQKAKDLIQKILQKHKKPYVAFSGGKDSLCLLHLVYKQNPNIDVMFHDSGVELPESYIQIQKIKETWGINLHVIKSPVNTLDVYKRKKGIFIGAAEDIAFNEVMGMPIKKWSKNNGNDLAFIGLRKEESKKRRIMLCKNGKYFYCKSFDIYECFPLADWKKEDVWAYIFSNYPLENLIHPAYFKDRLVKDPGDIRVSWYCDPTAARFGYFLWIKIYYPDLYNQLTHIFPEIKTFT